MERINEAPLELRLGYTNDEYQIVHIILREPTISTDDWAAVQLPEDIRWDRGIILNGRAPIWLYGMLIHRCHPARWIATVEPRLSAAVVVARHHPTAPEVGTLRPLAPPLLAIPTPDRQSKKKKPLTTSIALAIVGPPHSGKSVFVYWLWHCLSTILTAEEFNRDVFVLRACPDGEGNWSNETEQANVRILRCKHPWTEEFVQLTEDAISNLLAMKKLVLVDTGGKIDRWMQRILNRCTHAIIVSAKRKEFCCWRGALAASEVALVAEVESVRSTTCEVLRYRPLRVRVGLLERGTTGQLPDELMDAVLRISLWSKSHQ